MLVWKTFYILVFFYPTSTISAAISSSKNYCQKDNICYGKYNYQKLYQRFHIQRIALALPGVNQKMLRNGSLDILCNPNRQFVANDSAPLRVSKPTKYDLISYKSAKKEIHKELIVYSFVTSDEEQYFIEKSNLKFFFRSDAFDKNAALRVTVQRYVHNIPENKMISDRIHFSKHTYHKNSTNVADAQEIDILRIVKSVKNSTVYIRLSAMTMNGVSTTNTLDTDKDVYVNNFENKISKQRRRRSNNKCNGDCCFYDSHLKIKDTGWKWIISPRTILAGYCAGTCKKGDKFGKDSATMNKDYIPCCAPVKFQSTEIIYYNFNGNIQRSTIDALEITECGCV